MAGTGLQGAFALDALEQLLQQRMAAALQERAFQVQQQHLRVGEAERAREARAREQATEEARQLRQEALAAAGQQRQDAATERFFQGPTPAMEDLDPAMAARGRALGYGGYLRTTPGEPGDPRLSGGPLGELTAPGYRPARTAFTGGAAEQERIRQQQAQQTFAGAQAAERAQERTTTAREREQDRAEAARQRQADQQANIRLTAGLAEGGRTATRAAKADEAEKTRAQGLQAVQSHAQETLSLINQLQEQTPAGGTRLRSDVAPVVGASRNLGGGLTRLLPASANRGAENKILQLKNKLIVDLLGEMKSQSKTGATGFGQLNLRELQVIERAASRLDPNMSETDFNDALSEVRTKVSKILQPAGERQGAEEPAAPRRSVDDWVQRYRALTQPGR